MAYVQKTVEEAAVGVAFMDTPDKFSILAKPGVAAAIWRRQLPADFQQWINTLPTENLPSARVIVRSEVVRDAVEVICDSANMPNTFKRRFFTDDVVLQARKFSELMNTNLLRLRFDVVHDDACRKFHIDAVTARLVCTYRGPGTQYGISLDGEEPQRVFSAEAGSPILLRGTKWPEPPHSGLVHRSPPIEGSGIARLVLVIDPIFEEAKPKGETTH